MVTTLKKMCMILCLYKCHCKNNTMNCFLFKETKNFLPSDKDSLLVVKVRLRKKPKGMKRASHRRQRI